MLRSRIVTRPIRSSAPGSDRSNLRKHLVFDEPSAACPVDISTATYNDPAEAMEIGVMYPYSEATGPLWRVRIITFTHNEHKDEDNRSEAASHVPDCKRLPFELNLLWLAHHSIFDGRSQMTLIKELMAVLRQGPDHSAWNPNILGDPLPIPPRPDDIVGPAAPEVRANYDPAWQAPDPSRDRIRKEKVGVSLDQCKFRIHPFELDAATVTSLVARCREEGTTVHGALNAAALLAARQHILRASGEGAELAGNAALKIDWSGPVNMRPLTEPVLDPDSIGCYICSYMGLATVSGEDFWGLAKDVKKDLTSQLEGGIWRVDFNTVKEGSGLDLESADTYFGRAIFEAKARDPAFDINVNITNLGAFEFNSEEGDSTLHVWDVLFAPNIVARHVAFFLTCVTCDGRMSLSLVYTEPIMSKASVRAYVGSMLAHLRNAVVAG